MSDTSNSLIQALRPLTERVRTDVTALRRPGKPAAWTRDALTPEMLAAHLSGGPARGVCPIKAGESVTSVALLDFDSHRGEVSWSAMSGVVARVVDELELARGLSPVLFRSSGGRGVHVYLLWEEPQDAYSVREFLKDVLQACGLKSGTGGVGRSEVEVFPKQNEVAAGGFGNMWLLPLTGHSVPLALEEGDLW